KFLKSHLRSTRTTRNLMMNDEQRLDGSRRHFLKQSLVYSAAAASAASLLPQLANATQPLDLRYPSGAVKALDDSFMQLRLFNASVEKLADGIRWAEGPVWFGDGRYLLVSDIPNNRI